MSVSPEVRHELTERFAKSRPPSPEMSALLIAPDNDLFSVLERAEVECLPDMSEVPDGNFYFWIISQGSQLLHAMRLGFPETRHGVVAPFLAHQLIDSGQISGAEMKEDLLSRNIRLSACVSVESIFRVAAKAARTSALSAYLGLTKFLLATDRDAVFAHRNRVSERSFDRAKLHAEPLCTTKELQTPLFANGKEFDPRYWPVVLPIAGPNQKLMEATPAQTPSIPEIEIDIREPEVDIREPDVPNTASETSPNG